MKAGTITVGITLIFITAWLPQVAAQDAKKPDSGPFPDFDYEVICYAKNIFVQQGGSEGLASIATCKKEEEAARDYMREVWPKLLVTGRSS